MSDAEINSDSETKNPAPLATAVNILTSPTEAFTSLNSRPTILFPLAMVLLSTMAVMAWYFAMLDYSWYIDDTISRMGDLSEEQIERTREAMTSISQKNMTLLGIFGSAFSLLIVYTLQAGYLSLVSALSGDEYSFRHWFSAICWTSLPYLLVVISMAVNIGLSPNGQISAYDLNALSLSNLGMQSTDASINRIFTSLNLTMFWSLALMIMVYKQWLRSSLIKAVTVLTSPYLLIFGVWTFLALR